MLSEGWSSLYKKLVDRGVDLFPCGLCYSAVFREFILKTFIVCKAAWTVVELVMAYHVYSSWLIFDRTLQIIVSQTLCMMSHFNNMVKQDKPMQPRWQPPITWFTKFLSPPPTVCVSTSLRLSMAFSFKDNRLNFQTCMLQMLTKCVHSGNYTIKALGTASSVLLKPQSPRHLQLQPRHHVICGIYDQVTHHLYN